jgi:hypothetical protein
MMTHLAAVVITIAFSNYWPAWGGVNGSPHGHVASGAPWQEWAYIGAACPRDWAFGTRIALDGVIWTCIDRGSAIGYTRDGRAIIDFMTDVPMYSFKESVRVTVLPPLTVVEARAAARAATTHRMRYVYKYK